MEHLDDRREFPSFCIGIGKSPGTMDLKAYLLQKFSAKEREEAYRENWINGCSRSFWLFSLFMLYILLYIIKEVDTAREQGVEAVRSLVLEGLSSRITRFNLGQKYKYNKVRI